MYTINFTLKQHTPIIHFQIGQDGATLRGTEIKPKLDKFIIKKLRGWNNVPEQWKQKLNDAKNQALTYKIKVEQFDNVYKKVIERNEPFAPFFANMGDKYDEHNKKAFNFQRDLFECEILTWDRELHNFILEKNILPEFFALHNFGTRQSKGYGSFTVKSVEDEEKPFPANLFKYSFRIDLDNTVEDEINYNNYKSLFDKIDWFYRTLRSGINQKHPNQRAAIDDKIYIKSYLYMYANYFLNEQWDKKTIKKHFVETDQEDQCDLYDDDIVCDAENQDESLNKKNFRDLMGLSSLEKWGSYGFNLSKVEAENVQGLWVEKQLEKIEITRFKSPMLFKIYRIRTGFKVFFTFLIDDETYNRYTNATFIIKTSDSPDRLALPFYQNFNYFEYMDWVINNHDIENHIVQEGNYRIHNQIRETLINIYNQLSN